MVSLQKRKSMIKSKLFKIACFLVGGVMGLIFTALVIYVILYYPRKAEAFEFNASPTAKQILIATQGSQFKNVLSEALIDTLRKSSVRIKGIDVGSLSEVNDADWDRILIVNSFIIQLNKHIDRFIHRAQTTENILVYVTSGGADWLPQPKLQVDALTSASRMEYIDDLVHLITDWMERDIHREWEPDDDLLSLFYFPRVNVKTACESIASEYERYHFVYPNLENKLNRAGYQFLRLKDVPSALQVFELNVRLFPDSWNVYDSYGEALYANGDRKSAIVNYQMALQLNPESESAGKMLKKLAKE